MLSSWCLQGRWQFISLTAESTYISSILSIHQPCEQNESSFLVLALQAAVSAHTAECNRIRAENAAVADLHTKEIENKRQKEAQFKQAVERWHKHKDDAWAAHERDAANARALHNENVARMKAEWEAKRAEALWQCILFSSIWHAPLMYSILAGEGSHSSCIFPFQDFFTLDSETARMTHCVAAKIQVETINQNRLKQAEALHLRMVEDVTAINRRLAMEHLAKVEQRKSILDR
eukprot:1156271-Pelagomonas_calceolata.AAC.1